MPLDATSTCSFQLNATGNNSVTDAGTFVSWERDKRHLETYPETVYGNRKEIRNSSSQGVHKYAS